MTAMRGWAAALVVGLLAPSAWAQSKAKEPKPLPDDPKIEDVDEDAEATPAAPAPAPAPAAPPKPIKQDLSGHDLGSARRPNAFERDRFFVDKVDSEGTAEGTLVQGSLTSTSFVYHESGGLLTPPAGGMATVPSNSPYDRLFTDLRLQTDLRHISAGRWDARIDVRGRLVGASSPQTPGWVPVTETTVQSGWRGRNELDAKELWLVRKGQRSDVFIGRQVIADLGAVRIDGLRVDYAKSEALTLLGFAGLYPIRGSRSVTDDYALLKSEPDANGARTSAGRFVGAGGFGAAYRTTMTYGAIGGVVLAPLSTETPRVYLTSNGYWRLGTKLDFYHLAIVDVVGSNTANSGLTNLSLGLNWKPDQRLRGTLAFHRVDTETLNVQAQAFLQDPDRDNNVVQNEAYIQRIATNQGRASLSAGLGRLQRVELTAAVAYRYRGEVTLTPPTAEPNVTVLRAAQSLEVYGAITDRRSLLGLRLGVDGSRIFGVGGTLYQRTSSTTVRVFAGHEIGHGRGEWELEAAYSDNEDEGVGTACSGDLLTCFGAAKSTVVSGGGNLYVRFSRNWFAMASLFVNQLSLTHVEGDMSVDDPAVLGLSGFLRISHRF